MLRRLTAGGASGILSQEARATTIRLADPPGPARDSVLAMLRAICPEAKLELNADATVRATDPDVCREAVSEGSCGCVCHLIMFGRTVSIRVNNNLDWAGGGVTYPASAADATIRPDGKTAGPGTDCDVEIENQSRWKIRTAESPPRWIDEPDWLILAHELCGHVLRDMRGDHSRGPWDANPDPDWHDQASRATAALRRERGLPEVDETSIQKK